MTTTDIMRTGCQSCLKQPGPLVLIEPLSCLNYFGNLDSEMTLKVIQITPKVMTERKIFNSFQIGNKNWGYLFEKIILTSKVNKNGGAFLKDNVQLEMAFKVKNKSKVAI